MTLTCLEKKSTLFLSIGLIILIFGCNTTADRNNAHSDFDEIDSLRASFLLIEDSLVHTWNVMINDDNKKIKNAYRLVQEVAFAGGVDSTITTALLTNLKKLKSKRYNCKSMSDSDLIDYYDSMSNELINEAITLASNHSEFERNPLMNELIDEISASEGRILFFRIDYDDVAKVYNQFIEQHSSIMADIDPDNKRKTLPIFELPAEE